MKFSGILEIPSGISPEMGMFCLIWNMGYFSHSILVTELSFALKICKFWFFWNSCEIPEFIMEFEKIVLGYDMGCQFHSISSTKFKSTAQNVIYAQLKKFEINLNSKLMIKVFFFQFLHFCEIVICNFKVELSA